jgi:hypothetical protein
MHRNNAADAPCGLRKAATTTSVSSTSLIGLWCHIARDVTSVDQREYPRSKSQSFENDRKKIAPVNFVCFQLVVRIQDHLDYRKSFILDEESIK